MLEHIATLEHTCRLNDPERVGFESRVAHLEAELSIERQRSGEVEAEADARVRSLEQEVQGLREALAQKSEALEALQRENLALRQAMKAAPRPVGHVCAD